MDFDYKSMEASEKRFNERARLKILTLMSLETMFPDENTRALAKAAGRGKTAEVERIISSGLPVDARGTQGATALFWALKNYNGFKKLLELGANPSIIYGDGNAVIYMAARIKDPRFLRILLEHGANPNLKTLSTDEVAFPEQTPIFGAMSVGKEQIDLLISFGADLNAKDYFGTTPLMTAAMLGNFEIVHHLLEIGADYKIKDDAGEDLAGYFADRIEKMLPRRKEAKWQAKVIEWLQSRGVKVQKDKL